MDVEIDNNGNLFFLDTGAGLIGKLSQSNLENNSRIYELMYTRQKTSSLDSVTSLGFDRHKDFLYWTRTANDTDGYIYKAFSEPFVMERPFEKLNYAGLADTIYASNDHIYFSNEMGEIWLIRYKLSNKSIKVTEGLSKVTSMYGYSGILLIADKEYNMIAYIYEYMAQNLTLLKMTDTEQKVNSPLGIAVIPSKDNYNDLDYN